MPQPRSEAHPREEGRHPRGSTSAARGPAGRRGAATALAAVRRHVAPAAVVLAAFALRVLGVGDLPPGLYHDEAYYGLDAAGVLAGDLHLYFPANNGREPLFVYLAAVFVGVLGHTPAAVRLAAVFAGTAGAAAAFGLGRVLYGRWVGLVAAALFAVAPWPVILGRVGFRAGLLPLVLALAVAATVRGARGADRRWMAFGGAMAGLTLYTYTAARVAPLLALACCGAWLWRVRRAPDRRFTRRRLTTVWMTSAIAVALPLGLVFARDPAATLGRAAQVAVVAAGDPAGTLARNAVGTLGLVFVRGDFIPRHNIPWRPVLGPLGGLLFLGGLGVMLARRRARDGLVAAWLVVLALPTLLAENAPHFLRAAGLLPAVLVPPAVAVDELRRRAGRSRTAALAVSALTLGLVGAELAATVGYARAVMHPGAAAERLGFAFEAAAADLSREVNTALGAGWRGGWSTAAVAGDADAGGSVTASPAAEAPPRPRESPPPPAVGEGGRGVGARPPDVPPPNAHPPRAVWLDRRLRDGWASVPFLVDGDAVTLVDPYDPLFTTGPGVAFLQPAALEPEHIWPGMAPGLRVDFRDGPPARGDLEAEARPLYVRVDAQAAPAGVEPVATFADGLVLVAAEVEPEPDGRGVAVETVWSIRAPTAGAPTVFIQVLDGDRVVATADAPLGRGLFPVTLWRAGDQVVERRRLAVPDGYEPAVHRVITGAYSRPSLARIAVRAGGSAMDGDHVVLAGGN